MTKIIDSHVHVGSYCISSPNIYGWMQISIEDLLKYMNDHKIGYSWLLSHPNIIPGYELNNDRNTLMLATNNDKLIPFCSPNDYKEISSLVKKGCLGIGEVKRDGPINQPELMNIYREAANYNLPILIHVTNKHCSTNIKSLKEVFDIQTNFIMHGWEWWNLLNNGMDELLREHHNVFMDISANSGYKHLLPEHISKLDIISEFIDNWNDRILFGTDFPMLTIDDGTQFGANKQHINLINNLGLSEHSKLNILYRNAERLIK